ncbi:MAG: hypothetical protein B7W98_02755 [Parcubacteria group bacterium 20-58-5]|nr:MAG: hypothetical protein B7W98_02755 [Parcubacteria group bacterium 20-58-5]
MPAVSDTTVRRFEPFGFLRDLASRWDLAAFVVVIGLIAFLGEAGRGLFVPLSQLEVTPMSLNPSHLPEYAARTTLRMFVALIASLVFTLTYATWAAKSERAAKLFRRVCQVQRRPVTPLGVTGSSETLSGKTSPRASEFWIPAIATTLAAQIAVLPLLLYFTGNLSFVAIPANLITMPIVPLTMALSALAGFAGIVFGALSPIIGIALAFPAYLANAFLIFVAETSASLPFAAFTLPAFPFVLVLTAYAALIYIVASKRFSTTLQLRLAKNAST